MSATPYNPSPWGLSPNESSSYAPSPYATSAYSRSPNAPSPFAQYPAMPGQQQQQLKRPIAERHDKRDRDKDIVQLQQELWTNFASLEIPHVQPGPSQLRTKLHNKFRECQNPDHFVGEVEKEIKGSNRLLGDDFKLRPEEKELIRRIPHKLAHRYISEQRKECKTEGAGERLKLMGWDSIAKNLSAGMGFRYGKGSCKTYFEAYTKEHQAASTTRLTGPKRPHSPEIYVPAKDSRQSKVHITPGQYSFRDEHRQQERTSAGSREETMHDTLPPTTAPFELDAQHNILSAFSQTSLRDAITFDITKIKRIVDEEVAYRMRKQEDEMAHKIHELEVEIKSLRDKRLSALSIREDEMVRKIRALEAETKSLRDTGLSAVSLLDDEVKSLKTGLQVMSQENRSLHSQLKAQQQSNKGLQKELDASATEKKSLEQKLQAYENVLSSRNVRPVELDNTPSSPQVNMPVPPSEAHSRLPPPSMTTDEEQKPTSYWRDSGISTCSDNRCPDTESDGPRTPLRSDIGGSNDLEILEFNEFLCYDIMSNEERI